MNITVANKGKSSFEASVSTFPKCVTMERFWFPTFFLRKHNTIIITKLKLPLPIIWAIKYITTILYALELLHFYAGKILWPYTKLILKFRISHAWFFISQFYLIISLHGV